MVTDPQRIRRSDPGDPDVCNVFTLHKIISPPEEISQINQDCRKAEIGCVDCKRKLAANLNKHLEPFRSKRAEFEKDPDYVKDVLLQGAKRARVIASETMMEVREAIGFYVARD
jgi:tryptophanyl-tRNA synthetase